MILQHYFAVIAFYFIACASLEFNARDEKGNSRVASQIDWKFKSRPCAKNFYFWRILAK